MIKVSRSRNKIVDVKILPKTNEQIYFSILTTVQDRKTNSLVCFLGESAAQKFCFRDLLTFSDENCDCNKFLTPMWIRSVGGGDNKIQKRVPQIETDSHT